MRRALAAGGLALLLVAAACAPMDRPEPVDIGEATIDASLDAIARDYVRVTLEIGEREPGYVDAYYGPAIWAEEARAAPRDLEELAGAVETMDVGLDAIPVNGNPERAQRVRFLRAQLNAARTRLLMLRGGKLSFREESLGLFGATPELEPLASFDPVLAEIDALVPGEGPLDQRVEAFQNRYVIPPERLKPVMEAAIAECRARTARYIRMPERERFTMEFVTDKPWSGYNYYKGDFVSLIQINTDLPIRISRAVDLGCHEGYPGHHLLNMLLEQKLTRDRGWIEFSIYPLYSPQSLIAEGSANYGIDLAFPGEERLTYERDVLYPLAGLDPATARPYFELQQLLSRLGKARFTIVQRYLDGKIDREEAVRLTRKYQLVSEARARQSIDFADTYRSYVINYGLGRDMVADYIAASGQSPVFRWKAMEEILSRPTLPADLVVPD